MKPPPSWAFDPFHGWRPWQRWLYNRCPRWVYSMVIEGKPPHRRYHLVFGFIQIGP